LVVSRWRVETTFQEVRAHLGVETQRQWSDLAILRTTPALLGLFSLITVWADSLARDAAKTVRPNTAAWYRKQEPTFSDASRRFCVNTSSTFIPSAAPIRAKLNTMAGIRLEWWPPSNR
jgi:hypothetical protein